MPGGRRDDQLKVIGHGLSVITIGDPRRREFANIVQWARDHAHVVHWRRPRAVDRAQTKPNAIAALIIWMQSYAGEFNATDLDFVSDEFSGVPMLCAYGAYGEGETRTGKPLRGVPRFPFYCWDARIEPVWRDIVKKMGEADGLPSNARGPTSLRVGIYSASREMNQVLCDGLRSMGYHAKSIDAATQSDQIDVLVCEGSRDPRSEPPEMELVLARMSPCPAIVIEDFPRWQDLQRLSEIGVQHLLGKPFHLAELAHAIETTYTPAK